MPPVFPAICLVEKFIGPGGVARRPHVSAGRENVPGTRQLVSGAAALPRRLVRQGRPSRFEPFCKSQLPYKSVKLFTTLVIVKDDSEGQSRPFPIR